MKKASAHVRHCWASLLDNISACVSCPPDSDTASLEMHVSLLAPIRDRPAPIGRLGRARWLTAGQNVNIPKFCSDKLRIDDSYQNWGCKNYYWKISD